MYLDHILYPTITSEGFVTEVHNINGKGEDSGVVRLSVRTVADRHDAADAPTLAGLRGDERARERKQRSHAAAVHSSSADAGIIIVDVFPPCSLQRALYSTKNGLRSETGGLMEALRVLKVEQSERSA